LLDATGRRPWPSPQTGGISRSSFEKEPFVFYGFRRERATGVEPGVPVLERTADGSTRRRVEGSAVVGFFAAVCEALVELGPRLRRCDPAPEKNDSGRKYCSKYVAAVGHYRYCSATCSQRVRSRRYDDRPAAGGGSLLW